MGRRIVSLTCVREPEVTAALRSGAWPAACEPALRQHVAECSQCGETVLLTQAFLGARAQAVAETPAVSAGALWWRAQLRRRREAVERVTRPIVLVEIVAVLATLAALGVSAWLWVGTMGMPSWLPGLAEARAALPTWFDRGFVTLAIAGAATLALLGGLTLYLVAEKE